MKRKKFISMLLCAAMLAPLASMAMPVGAQGESQNTSSSVGVSEDIGEPGVDYIDGEVIVKFKSAVSGIVEGQAVDFFGDINGIVTSALNFSYKDEDPSKSGLVDLIIFKSETLSTKELLDRFANRENVKYAEPNYINKMNDQVKTETPQFNDILSGTLNLDGLRTSSRIGIKENTINNKQWGLKNIGQDVNYLCFGDTYTIKAKAGVDIDVESIWNRGVTGSKDFVIAVMVDGIDYEHESLKGNLWDNQHGGCGYSAVDDGELDENGQMKNGWQNEYLSPSSLDLGTGVAGIIGANSIKGMSGVMRNAQIMPIKVGKERKIDDEVFLKGLNFIEGQLEEDVPIRAVDIPFFTRKKTEIYEDIERKINELGDRYGIMFICSAGEFYEEVDGDPCNVEVYPACLDSEYIISVGAINADGTSLENTKLFGYNSCLRSNYGKDTVDVLAPGFCSYTTTSQPSHHDTRSIYPSGFASAFITGSFGLLTAYSDYNDLGWSPRLIRDKIMNGTNTELCTNLAESSASGGFFQLDKALKWNSYGWQRNKVQGYWEYLDDNNNYLTGWRYDIPGYEEKIYYFDENGHMLTGRQEINGNYYYFNWLPGNEEGQLLTAGWVKDEDGAYFYCDESGVVVTTHGFKDPDNGNIYSLYDGPVNGQIFQQNEIDFGQTMKIGQVETGFLYDPRAKLFIYYSSDTSNNESNLGNLILGTNLSTDMAHLFGPAIFFLDTNGDEIEVFVDYFPEFENDPLFLGEYYMDKFKDVDSVFDQNYYGDIGSSLDYDAHYQVAIKIKKYATGRENLYVMPYDSNGHFFSN